MNRHRILLVLGILLLAALAPVGRLGDLRVRTGALLWIWAAAHAAYLGAAWVATRPAARERADASTRLGRPLAIVVAIGVVARLLLIPVEPTLSEDVHRYLWDGRLVSLGFNPYEHTPDDPALRPHRGELFQRLNHPHVPAIYPPAAQLLFGAVARLEESPLAFKLALLPIEASLWLALVYLLRRRGLPEERLLLFAWNPLVVLESYGSGHVDLAAAAFLVLALAMLEAKRKFSAGIAFAVGALTKYTPLLLVPYLIRRREALLLGVAAATALLFYLPFSGAGAAIGAGLSTYLIHWEFNGALYPVLRTAIESDRWVRVILAAALAVSVLWIALRARTAAGAACALWIAYLLASPTVFPWYLLPLVALFPLFPNAALLVFSGLVALSYHPLPAYHATGVWALPGWIPWVEYGGAAVVALLAAAGAWKGRRRYPARRAACATESPPT